MGLKVINTEETNVFPAPKSLEIALLRIVVNLIYKTIKTKERFLFREFISIIFFFFRIAMKCLA